MVKLINSKDRSKAADGLLKSGLKLIGSKCGSTKDSGRSKIYKLLPKGKEYYIESFLGTGSCLIGKQEISKFELVNDLNPYVINFFKCMQADPQHLWKVINTFLENISEEKWLDLRDDNEYYNIDKETLSYRKAAWFYTINKYARNGIFRWNKSGKCNSTFCKTLTGRGIYDEDWYYRVVRRIKSTIFYSDDFETFLTTLFNSYQINKDNSIMLIDSPYLIIENGKVNQYGYYSDPFGLEEHNRLAKVLKSIDSQWLMTINDNEIIRQLYDGYPIIEHEIFYSCSNTSKGRGNRSELFIANYPINKEMIYG